MDLLPHQIIHLASPGPGRARAEKRHHLDLRRVLCLRRALPQRHQRHRRDGRAAAKSPILQGVACPRPEILKFHQCFIKDLGRRGRIHEIRMMGEYNLAIGKPFNNASLGPKMFLKGRLHLLPPKALRGFKSWMKKIMASLIPKIALFPGCSLEGSSKNFEMSPAPCFRGAGAEMRRAARMELLRRHQRPRRQPHALPLAQPAQPGPGGRSGLR